MQEQPEIRFLGDLQRLEIKPGDRFVLKMPAHISLDTAEKIQTIWNTFTDGKAGKLLILDGGMELGAISFPEKE